MHEQGIILRDGIASSTRKRGRSRGMRASATYLYSSWERAQQDYLDHDEEGEHTIVDSLSRLLELASQFDDAVDS